MNIIDIKFILIEILILNVNLFINRNLKNKKRIVSPSN